MAVWEHNKLVLIGLSVLLAGQFGIIFRAMTGVKGTYIDDISGCQLTSVEANLGAAIYIATMVVDFVILSLTVYKTYVQYRSSYHSGLIKLIFRDGLVYFAVV